MTIKKIFNVYKTSDKSVKSVVVIVSLLLFFNSHKHVILNGVSTTNHYRFHICWRGTSEKKKKPGVEMLRKPRASCSDESWTGSRCFGPVWRHSGFRWHPGQLSASTQDWWREGWQMLSCGWSTRKKTHTGRHDESANVKQVNLQRAFW